MSARMEQGSTLIEALVATLVLTTGVLTMAQLMSLASRSNLASRQTTSGSILAGWKLEELRTQLDLQASPSQSLDQDTPGFVDYLDAAATILPGTTSAPPGAVYTRRWSVEPLTSGRHMLIQVAVTARLRGPGPDRVGGGPRAGEVRVASVTTRRVP